MTNVRFTNSRGTGRDIDFEQSRMDLPPELSYDDFIGKISEGFSGETGFAPIFLTGRRCRITRENFDLVKKNFFADKELKIQIVPTKFLTPEEVATTTSSFVMGSCGSFYELDSCGTESEIAKSVLFSYVTSFLKSPRMACCVTQSKSATSFTFSQKVDPTTLSDAEIEEAIKTDFSISLTSEGEILTPHRLKLDKLRSISEKIATRAGGPTAESMMLGDAATALEILRKETTDLVVAQTASYAGFDRLDSCATPEEVAKHTLYKILHRSEEFTGFECDIRKYTADEYSASGYAPDETGGYLCTIKFPYMDYNFQQTSGQKVTGSYEIRVSPDFQTARFATPNPSTLIGDEKWCRDDGSRCLTKMRTIGQQLANLSTKSTTAAASSSGAAAAGYGSSASGVTRTGGASSLRYAATSSSGAAASRFDSSVSGKSSPAWAATPSTSVSSATGYLPEEMEQIKSLYEVTTGKETGKIPDRDFVNHLKLYKSGQAETLKTIWGLNSDQKALFDDIAPQIIPKSASK